MARKKASEDKQAIQATAGSGRVKNTSNVQADRNSIAIGEINIGGDLSGSFTVGYTAEQVSLLLEQFTAKYQRKPFDGRCPYKGLEVFEEADAELFFGRERLVEYLLNRVKESRTVFITGPSGSGKSSLVRAGLLHTLRQGGLTTLHSERWLYETMKPGREPLKELASAFSRLKGPDLADYFLAHTNEIEVLNKCVESVLSGSKTQRFVLFVDQFEEIFSPAIQEQERLAFLDMLAQAGTVENGRIIVLFAMRSDFLSNCAPYSQLNGLINQSRLFQVGAMQSEELVAAIALPAKQVGLPIEDELIARIINDMKGEPGALPLMQFALKDLFDSQQARGDVIGLQLEDYLGQGGIQKSLARHADTSLATLDEHQQKLARSIFSGLIETDRGTQETRRTALFEELVPANTKSEEVLTVVQRLADARLIITDEQAGKDTVTISHEKLIEAWPWLKKLVDENHDAIALQNEIKDDAKEWDDHQRDPSYLYIGARLANAREKMEARKLVLSDLAQIYIDTGIEMELARHREEERRRQKELDDAYKLAETEARRAEEQAHAAKRLRQRAIYLTVALAASLLAVGLAVFFGIQAKQQAKISRARDLAATSITALDLDPDLSMHLAMQSINEMDTPQGEDALRRAILAPPVEQALVGHTGAVYSVAYDGEGKRLVTGSEDGTARIWDTITGDELISLRGHRAAVYGVAFSPNGQLVATASADQTVRLWDANTGQQLRSLEKHSAAVNSVAFSPDGGYLVTASDDKTVRVWKVADGSEVYALDGHTAAVRCAVFSPNGQLIATGGDDQTINFWDARTGRLTNSISNGSENVNTIAFSPDSSYILFDWAYNAYRWDILNGASVSRYFGGHTWYLTSVAFSPSDGNQVVTASRDHTVRLWDTATGNQIEILRGQGGTIYSVAFDPGGEHLATASEDHTVRIWNLGEWHRRVLSEPGGYVLESAYSPDGHEIATSGSDGIIRIWDAATGHQLNEWEYPGYVANRIHFSPDNQTIITASDDETWGIWEATTGQELFRSDPIGSIVSDARFSSDGTQILTTQRDNRDNQNNVGIVWDAKTEQPLVQLQGHSTGLWTGSFSPDGRLAVTASADRTARVWDVKTGEQLQILTGHNDLVTSAAFSSDGKRIVTTSVDTTARIWDTETGQLLLVLQGHTLEVTDAAFSPTDPYVATVSRDHTVILWNANTGDELIQLFGNNKDIFRVGFSPDGKHLITSGLDGTARIYPVHFEDVLTLARTLLSPRELTCAERVKYSHEKLVCPTPIPMPTSTP